MNRNSNHIVFIDNFNEYNYYYNKNSVLKTDVTFKHGIFELTNNTLIRKLCLFHYKFCYKGILPYSSMNLWKHILFRNLFPSNTNKNYLIVTAAIYVNFLQFGILNYIKKLYGCKIIIFFSDIVNSYKNLDINKMRLECDLITTYNEIDAKTYGFEMRPPIVFDIKYELDNNFDTDVYFVARPKGRMDTIYDIYEKCINAGLRCNFNICSKKDKRYPGINFIDTISYTKIISCTHKTKCILNIMQPGSSGVTLRDIEAYNNGVFIISNNNSNELEQIFNKEQHIYMTNNNFDQELNKIKLMTKRFEKKTNTYTYDNFFNWIIEKLNNNDKETNK